MTIWVKNKLSHFLMDTVYHLWSGRQGSTKSDKGRQGSTRVDKGRQSPTRADKGRLTILEDMI